MNTNKITIIGSVLIILLIILIPTTYKVIKNHQKSLYEVVEKKIIDASKKCFYEEKCNNEHITLKELYDLNYLEPISNPISKEYYNEESYVERNNNNFKFIPKE